MENTVTENTLLEALELIKALAPKAAPNDISCINFFTGLSIIKSDVVPDNTIIVGKKLFDLIYEAAKP